MATLQKSGRVECLTEIRPGKICGAHRMAEHVLCSVCGAPSHTRPVALTKAELADRVSVVLVLDFRQAS